MAEAGADAFAVTSDGSSSGQLHALVTSRDIARAFGDQPISILREIRLAATIRELRELNHRARALALQYLTSAASLDWLARFVSLTDVNIVKRIIALDGRGGVVGLLVLLRSVRTGRIADPAARRSWSSSSKTSARVAELAAGYERVSDALAECDYLPRADMAFDRSFHVASRAEWQARYEQWLRDPVLHADVPGPPVVRSAARSRPPVALGRHGGHGRRREWTAISCTCWPTTAWRACRR